MKKKIDLIMRNKLAKLFTSMMILVLITSFTVGFLSMQGISPIVDDSSFSVSNLSTQDMIWPPSSSEWTEVAPETQGLDSDKIADMFEYIEDYSYMIPYDIHSVIIVRNGYLLVEEYLYNYQLLDTKEYSDQLPPKSYDGPIYHDQASTTKSLISILIGIALQQNLLNNLNQTLYEFFADIWEPSFVDSELKKNITIEQLLTMNSGLLGGGPGYPSTSYPPADCINLALDDVPLAFTPGEAGEFEYSNDGPNLLSGIITNVTGTSTETFAQDYLFTPLGISGAEYSWPHDNKGIDYGGYEFKCSPKVQAKLGILCLNNGTWNGTQIVDKDYLKDATTQQVPGYGYLFYTGGPHGGYYTIGSGGQNIYVIPKYNITIGFTGATYVPYNSLIVDYIVQFAEDNAPEWDQIPIDQLIQEGDSFLYEVNASDTSGVDYSIDDTVNFNITSEGIITNSRSLSAGVYPLEIRAYNPFNNNITASINVEVIAISSNGIPGFDFNMILIMILCTSVVIIIIRKKIIKKV